MNRRSVESWLSLYAEAWERADPDGAAALFTPDASYRSHVFRQPHVGEDAIRAYWARATSTQSEVEVAMGSPIVSDEAAVAEWWTTMIDRDDGEVTLPGVLVLRFEGDRCASLREYWARGEGRRLPPPHWGTVDVAGRARAATLARSWCDRYRDAWRRRDAAAIPPLFADDAVYASHPLREPHVGRADVRRYTDEAYADEFDVDVAFAVIASAGSTGVVEYWARLTEAGEPATLAGCDILAFDDDGLCSMLREYWHLDGGHRAPPPEWGR